MRERQRERERTKNEDRAERLTSRLQRERSEGPTIGIGCKIRVLRRLSSYIAPFDVFANRSFVAPCLLPLVRTRSVLRSRENLRCLLASVGKLPRAKFGKFYAYSSDRERAVPFETSNSEERLIVGVHS